METTQLSIGGISKAELLRLLKDQDISINPLGNKLLQSNRFTIKNQPQTMTLAFMTLKELGFIETGPTLPEIISQVKAMGLDLCPPETGPFLRLAYSKDKNSQGMEKQFRTPDGAVTVLSVPLSKDHDFPKGFYLRKVDGTYWLRGYTCDDQHRFDVTECFVFQKIMQ